MDNTWTAIKRLLDQANHYRYVALKAADDMQRQVANQMADAAIQRAKELAAEDED